MIVDNIENLEAYISLNPYFKIVAEYLKNNNLEDLKKGKTLIKDTDVFVNIEKVKGKSISEAVLEYHSKMIDIQIPITAAETYGFTQRDQLPDVPYNAEKDITKIPELAADSYVTCQPGMMAIFFPQDGHAPCIATVPEFKKAIFKIKA